MAEAPARPTKNPDTPRYPVLPYTPPLRVSRRQAGAADAEVSCRGGAARVVGAVARPPPGAGPALLVGTVVR